ncbi:hypothetical protein AVEN_155142-1 [Araneus ventricosus]|uniref:Uncharacterized protein n=1 Tax=Araneus ventricosus TaxID=182803 RepID=A0A4Y2T786_ARAVE|nr:hypothetical protein AVEN_155142-1 [Araneus ventricosus]
MLEPVRAPEFCRSVANLYRPFNGRGDATGVSYRRDFVFHVLISAKLPKEWIKILRLCIFAVSGCFNEGNGTKYPASDESVNLTTRHNGIESGCTSQPL